MSDLPVACDHCVIHVSDWQVAKEFYTQVMGAEAIKAMQGRGLTVIDAKFSSGN